MAIEKDMLISASIPELLVPAIRDLMISTVGGLKEEINVAELYFTDTSALGLVPQPVPGSFSPTANSPERREHFMDAMRKVELKKGAVVKRCTKCGNATEDVPFTKGSNIAVLGLQRHCLCGGWWMALDEDEQGDGF